MTFWFLTLLLLGAFRFGFLFAVLCSKDITFSSLRLEREKERKKEVGLA